MKSILNLNLIFVLLCINTVLSKHLDEHDVVGVSQKKITNLVKDAILGYRTVLRNGDKELGHPVKDPSTSEELTWEVNQGPMIDFILTNTNATIIRGLSNYEVKRVDVDSRSLSAYASLIFEKIEAEIPYEIDGSMIKSVLPIYGKGIAKITVMDIECQLIIKLGLQDSYVIVEDVDPRVEMDGPFVEVTGLMDMDDEFTAFVIEDILNDDELIYSFLKKELQETAEEAFGGMTLDEMFDFFKYLAKKAQ